MKALAARGLCRCSARATSSLPVPDSPVISTVMLERESRPMARNTSCMAGAWPSISGIRARLRGGGIGALPGRGRASHELDRLIDVERLRQVFERAALVGRHGAVEIGVRGHDDHRQARTLGADLLQELEAAAARHADIGDQHVGSSRRSALSTASDSSNSVVAMPPCLSARSSTQRIEASSSTTQTLSMFAEPVVVEGQQDREDGASGPTLELDQAVVAADQVLRYGEAKAGAARARRSRADRRSCP